MASKKALTLFNKVFDMCYPSWVNNFLFVNKLVPELSIYPIWMYHVTSFEQNELFTIFIGNQLVHALSKWDKKTNEIC